MRTFYYHTGKVNFIAYSPDGGMILTGSKDNRAVIWDPETTYVDREFIDTEPVESVSFSRTGMFVLTGSDNRLAKVWDTRNGQQVCVLNGHTGKVEAVAMNPE
jgi:WD40 repeat protein